LIILVQLPCEVQANLVDKTRPWSLVDFVEKCVRSLANDWVRNKGCQGLAIFKVKGACQMKSAGLFRIPRFASRARWNATNY
jgi:hypothetical protein